MNKKELFLFSLLILLLVKEVYDLGYTTGQLDVLEEGLDAYIKRMLDAEKTTPKNKTTISPKSGESTRRYTTDKERIDGQSVHAE